MPCTTNGTVSRRGFAAPPLFVRNPRAFASHWLAPVGLLGALALVTACPGQVSGSRQGDGEFAIGADDPRVVQEGKDLYPADSIERVRSRSGGEDSDPESENSPGTGRPDETNGVCRLFAPKLPNPTCCEVDYGFDVATVQRICGHDTYLGESFQFSCGYYFHSETTDPPWFRMSFLPSSTVEQAAQVHDAKLGKLVGESLVPSQPVPGVEGAMWSHDGEHHWAFLPGWSKVRQLAWRNESCSNDGAAALIKQLVAAQEPPEDAERLALIPKARP
jgi:hypothetical protein